MKKFLWAILLTVIPYYSVWGGFIQVTGVDKDSVQKVIVSPIDDRLIYTISEDILFRSKDRGRTWEKVFISRGEEIRDLFVDRHLYDTVYLLSESSLYLISPQGNRKLFGIGPEEETLAVIKTEDTLYLGTTHGLLVSREDTGQWSPCPGFLNDIPVYALDSYGAGIVLATAQGVYSFKDNEGVKKAIVRHSIETEADEPASLSISTVAYDRYDQDIIYLGTSEGLFVSRDGGRLFFKQYISHLENADIRCISQPSDAIRSLYVATDGGLCIVDLDYEESRSLFEGLPTEDIFWLDWDTTGRLFVATGRGLFQKEEFTLSSYSIRMQELIKDEPGYLSVQQAALTYNEVHPQKVQKWRNALKYRALFPQISVDYDKSVYGSSSGQFAVGPRDWGVNIAWDVGDLIWNSYEDDIDTRSRLTAQLRNNILDDINTVYFARVRVKAELADPSLKKDDRLKKELRLMELTAILDGYTGGFFSKQSKPVRDKN
ncbi:MAG: hypothetical protein JXD21_05110 [Candidatus Omnitrophica bacterium]|nr:hypothetical protein [Candidatus Omnitrophota bacterium]